MNRVSKCFVILLLPVLAVTFTATGCGDKKEEKPKAGAGDKKADGDKGSAGTPAGAPEAIVGKGVAVLKGKISYDGDAPAGDDFAARMKDHKDGEHCLKGPTKDPKWTVAADKGVKNVVVWVKAPKGKFFQLSDDQKKSADQPKVDQPFCLFEPHVAVAYPSYFDGKKQVPTGQTFKVANSAPIAHNTAWKGNDLVNPGRNETIKAGGDVTLAIKPAAETKSGEDLIKLNCDLHKWMEGYVWVFDHPFAAVTKDDGTFEIKGIPAGADVEIAYWHESMGRTPKIEKKSLKDGDNEFSVKIK